MLKTSRRAAKRHLAIATLATATLVLTACAPTDEADPDTTASDSSSESPRRRPAADECTPDTMETLTAGTLTIATDDPAYEPWFVDNDPTNGQGYESAVAYAIAEQLGYTQDQVAWVKVPFNKVVQPGPKDFDFDVNQVSITEARRKAVDFSSGYYDVVQTVITNKGSAIDGIDQRRRPRRRQARRPGRHDELHRDHRPDPALAGAGGLRHQRPGRAGAEERPDRRHRRRPARRRTS